MYVLDALPMALALFVIAICHPGRSLVGASSEFPKSPTRKEKKAAKEARKAEKLELAKQIGGGGRSEGFKGERQFESGRAWEQAV